MNNTYTIWVDADSCQSKARSVLLQKAKQNKIPVTYVANRPIPFSIENSLFTMIVCDKKKDEADNYIVNNIKENDIIITRDLPLAKRIIEKENTVLNDRGVIFTKNTIDKMLRERELSLQMAALGIRNGKFNTYAKEDIENFSKSLSHIIEERNKN
ncbi:MAG: DUF188 domain-containing protein [Treponema sp.]|nr:DUF188 domain-containing protein [Treponema sp.]